MSIRYKLIVSYTTMLLVPFVSILLISYAMVVYFHGDNANWQVITQSTEDVLDSLDVDTVIHQIKRKITLMSSTQLEQARLEEWSKELAEVNSKLYVQQDSNTVYPLHWSPEEQHLFSQISIDEHPDSLNQWTRPVLIKQSDSYLLVSELTIVHHEGASQTVFITTQMQALTYFIRHFFPTIFISLLLLMITTNIITIRMMAQKIIKPLEMLRKSTDAIKHGKLNTPISVKGTDEIGQLGLALENMRTKLQDSLLVQQNYETNRKYLLSSISHDLRTPLTSIHGYIEGILDGVVHTPEKIERYLRIVHTKVSEMNHLIDELFLYSKLDLQQIPFHFEPVALHAFLNDWIDDVQYEVTQKKMEFEGHNLVSPTLFIRLDREQFRRALSQIVQNSLKYIDGSALKLITIVAIQEDAKFIKITIKDTGSGISDEALPHVFERFYRSDESRNTGTGGSGLGLAICKEIIRAHDGEIHIDSRLQQWTIVTITLPIVSE